MLDLPSGWSGSIYAFGLARRLAGFALYRQRDAQANVGIQSGSHFSGTDLRIRRFWDNGVGSAASFLYDFVGKED